MKKLRIILLSIFFIAVSLFAPSSALAQFKPNEGPNFDDFNPLIIDGSPLARELSSDFRQPANIINRAILYLFPAAGLILFLMIVWGGFEMVMSAANSKSKDAGRQRVTAAIIGFGLLFASYWIVQIVEVVFSVNIL